MGRSGKILRRRRTPEEKKRSAANHERIGMAISEATSILQAVVPDVSLSRDYCYQFANRIAFAWKLASMGVPAKTAERYAPALVQFETVSPIKRTDLDVVVQLLSFGTNLVQ
jgi:hypothetical protein